MSTHAHSSDDNSNGTNGILIGLPKWARGIMSASAVTIITAIAVWLIYIVSGELRADTRSLGELLRTHASETGEMKKDIGELNQLMRLVCVNTSPDVAQRNACLSVGSAR